MFARFKWQMSMNNESHLLDKFRFCPVCGSPRFEVNDFKSKRCPDCGLVYYTNPCASCVAVILNERDELLVVRRACEPAKGTLDGAGCRGGRLSVLTAQHLPVRRSRSPHLRHVLPVPSPLRQGLMRRRRRIGGNVDSMERNQARGIRIMLHKERRRSTFIKKTCINKVRIGKNALPLRPKSKKSV